MFNQPPTNRYSPLKEGYIIIKKELVAGFEPTSTWSRARRSTTELYQLLFVLAIGLEPMSPRLRAECSATELYQYI